ENESEKVELNRRIAEVLRQAVEESKWRDAVNAELKARIEELEKNKTDSSAENVRRDVEIAEIKAEVKKLKDNNEENKKLTQEISPEGVVNVHNSISDQCDSATSCVSDQKSPEDGEMDAFLDEARKKNISDRIRQHNKEKLNKASFNQDQESVPKGLSDTGLTVDNCTFSGTSTSENPMTEISVRAPLLKNSHRKKGVENISQMISDGIQNDAQSQKCILSSSNDILSQQSQISSIVPLLTLAQLFDKVTDAEYGAIHAN
ncbi:1289_t:CDS:1, partial [Scutellospora calospora]